MDLYGHNRSVWKGRSCAMYLYWLMMTVRDLNFMSLLALITCTQFHFITFSFLCFLLIVSIWPLSSCMSQPMPVCDTVVWGCQVRLGKGEVAALCMSCIDISKGFFQKCIFILILLFESSHFHRQTQVYEQKRPKRHFIYTMSIANIPQPCNKINEIYA